MRQNYCRLSSLIYKNALTIVTLQKQRIQDGVFYIYNIHGLYGTVNSKSVYILQENLN